MFIVLGLIGFAGMLVISTLAILAFVCKPEDYKGNGRRINRDVPVITLKEGWSIITEDEWSQRFNECHSANCRANCCK